MTDLTILVRTEQMSHLAHTFHLAQYSAPCAPNTACTLKCRGHGRFELRMCEDPPQLTRVEQQRRWRRTWHRPFGWVPLVQPEASSSARWNQRLGTWVCTQEADLGETVEAQAGGVPRLSQLSEQPSQPVYVRIRELKRCQMIPDTL